jgi:2,3-bisphosphoglycerate-dependent phosphoglycerate mutase
MQNGNTDIELRSRRPRRIRAIITCAAIAIAVGLVWFFESQATTTIIFVRHAEKDSLTAEDPGLSPAGRRRAAELARQLVDADVVAGVDAIYSTPFKRTLDTALPLAEALGLEINRYAPSDNEAVLATILHSHKGKVILVVGHSNTVPTLMADLGASKRVPPIAEFEYDNIYVASIPWFGKTKAIRLRYGEPYTGEPIDENVAGATMTQ